MVTKTIGNVIDDIDSWESQYGTLYSVVAFFINGELVKANKKSYDAALELQGLLKEVVEVPQDFVLEQDGTSKKGAPKWKLLAFGPEGGPYTYSTLKAPGGASKATGSYPPERDEDQDEPIRRAVALKAAAIWGQGKDISAVLFAAGMFEEHLKASGSPPPSTVEAPTVPSPGDPEALSPTAASATGSDGLRDQGAGTSPVGDTASAVRAAEDEGGQAGLGEGSPAPSHQHSYKTDPNAVGWRVCDCGDRRKRSA